MELLHLLELLRVLKLLKMRWDHAERGIVVPSERASRQTRS